MILRPETIERLRDVLARVESGVYKLTPFEQGALAADARGALIDLNVDLRLKFDWSES